MRVLSVLLSLQLASAAWYKLSSLPMEVEVNNATATIPQTVSPPVESAEELLQDPWKAPVPVIHYGDAISLKHLVSELKLKVSKNHPHAPFSALEGKAKGSTFEVLNRDQATNENKVVSRFDTIMLKDLDTGKFVGLKSTEGGALRIVAAEPNKANFRNFLWNVDGFQDSLQENKVLRGDVPFVLKNNIFKSYLHSRDNNTLSLILDATENKEDGHNVLFVSDYLNSTEVQELSSGANTTNGTEIKYGDVIALEHTATGKSVATLAQYKGSTLTGSVEKKAFFQVLHENGSAMPYEPVSDNSTVVLMDMETGYRLMAFPREHGRKQIYLTVRHTQPRDMLRTQFRIKGVFGSLDNNASLSVGTKFMIKSAVSGMYLRSAASVGAKSGFVLKGYRNNGYNVFTASFPNATDVDAMNLTYLVTEGQQKDSDDILAEQQAAEEAAAEAMASQTAINTEPVVAATAPVQPVVSSVETPVVETDPTLAMAQGLAGSAAAAPAAPVASKWTTAVDPATGRQYYWNTETRETSWTAPETA